MPYSTKLNANQISKLSPGQRKLRAIVQDNMEEFEKINPLGKQAPEYQDFCKRIQLTIGKDLEITGDKITGRNLENRFYAKTFYSFLQVTGVMKQFDNYKLNLDPDFLIQYDYNRTDRTAEFTAFNFAGIGVDFVAIYFKVMSDVIELDTLNFWVHQYDCISNYQFTEGNHRGLGLHLLGEPKTVTFQKYFLYEHKHSKDELTKLNEALKKIEKTYFNLRNWDKGVSIQDVINCSQKNNNNPSTELISIKDVINDYP